MVVACVDCEQARGLALSGGFKGLCKRAFEFGAQMLHLRPQPCLCQPLCHEQPLTKRAEQGRLATLPHDQFLAQLGLPMLELSPHVPVRQAEVPRRSRNRAVAAHCVQHIHHGVAQQGCRV